MWADRTVSVVVALDGAGEHVPDRLAAFSRACDGLAAELVFVHQRDAHIAPTAAIPLRTVPAPSGLVPVMWGHGIAAARGSIVVLTTTQFVAREAWLRALLRRFDEADVVGAGGSIDLVAGAGMLGRAVYLIRYSEHLPAENARPPHEIAGDNAAYRRDAVVRVCPDLPHGFWEVDAHRRLRAQRGRIVHARDAVLDFAPVLSVRGVLRNRFVHGGHFGAYRVRELRWPRWRALAVTPLVPAALLWRIIGRVRRAGGSVTAALSALPVMLPLLVAWAAGEAHGALSRAGARDVG